MDKNTTTGFLLIGAVLMAFLYLNRTNDVEKPNESNQIESNEANKNVDSEDPELINDVSQDSSNKEIVNNSIDNALSNADIKLIEEQDDRKKYGLFYKGADGIDQEDFLQNSKIRLSFSSKGARINSAEIVELNKDGEYKYKTHTDFVNNVNNPIRLFNKENSFQSLRIIDEELEEAIETGDLFFKLQSSSEKNITYRLETDNPDQYLEFSYTLEPDSNHVDFEINYHNLENKIRSEEIGMRWGMDGISTEKLADDERMTCSVMYRYNNEGRDYITERSSNNDDPLKIEGDLNWVAFKHKFFSSILISENPIKSGYLVQEQLQSEDYTIRYKSDVILPKSDKVKLKFFFGPNEYDLMASYDNEMDGIINLGWGIFRWTNNIMIEPIFNFLKSWGIGFGWIILLLTLFVKIIILPLTYKNYTSSAKMKVLKPEIAKITEKYQGKTDKDAAMKKQRETMSLYKQTGVNPMAGCIPVLIQMPILLAVFRFLPSSIDLRHQGFLWAEDLSSYDSILELGFEIPFYGDHVSLFTLLMAVSTLFYTILNSSQMSGAQQPGMPNMKIIMYLFPIMMIFFFNTYSSGLSYYYLCGNMMNMGIMWAIKKYMIDEDKIRLKIEENKKKPKKKSKFQQRMDEIAKQQQKRRK
ncbi:MAG: membrane protein insertase YidC [Crocinitomicaceae bacterium]|nr:membrane protein insertase YidC [Crocinitomicaceae bacterium]